MIRLFFGAVFALLVFVALVSFPIHIDVASFFVEYPKFFAGCIGLIGGAGLMAMMNR